MRNVRRVALIVLAVAGPGFAGCPPGVALAATPSHTTHHAAAGNPGPIQISLFPPVQIVREDRSVGGVRLDILYGKNVNVTGIDWGLVNHTTGDELAWQDGIVNYVEHNAQGWQDGFVNMTNGEFTGLQSGFFNQSESANGVAFGVVNYTKHMHGLQLGILNMTETMHGLQIGVGNVIQKGKIPILPIVNWSF